LGNYSDYNVGNRYVAVSNWTALKFILKGEGWRVVGWTLTKRKSEALASLLNSQSEEAAKLFRSSL